MGGAVSPTFLNLTQGNLTRGCSLLKKLAGEYVSRLSRRAVSEDHSVVFLDHLALISTIDLSRCPGAPLETGRRRHEEVRHLISSCSLLMEHILESYWRWIMLELDFLLLRAR